jgi:putative transcriptional regulator
MSDFEKATFFERLRKGIQEGIAYSRGELNLKTTELPMPPPRTGAAQIVHLRKRLGMSQTMFAATLNVSPRTVQSWEQGLRQPADAALRMLQVIGKRPHVVRLILSSGAGSGRRPGSRRQRSTRHRVAV